MASARRAPTGARESRVAAMPLLTAAGHPVAPHVAARLARLTAGDAEAVREVAAVMGRECLAGVALVPDPLPPVAAMRAGVDLIGLDDEARRVLLVAAVAVLDRADILLAASGAGVDALLTGPASEHLELDAGRFRFLDPRVRALVHEDADLAARTWAHTALASTLRIADEPAIALWHTALCTLAGDPHLADGLVTLAERQLRRGDAVQSHQIAREAANQGTGEVRARAFLAAGRAALWAGHLHDASAWLRRAVSTGVVAVRGSAERSLTATQALLHGRRGTTGPDDLRTPPGARLARLVGPVSDVAASPADRAVMSAVVEGLNLLDAEPGCADAVLARAALAAVPARGASWWAETCGALSPLAEAHLRVVQALALFRAGDRVRAAEVLLDAAGRLPLAHVAGGLATALLRRLERERLGATGVVAAALEAVGPVGAARSEAAAAMFPGSDATASEPGGGSLVARTLRARRAEAGEQRWSSASSAPRGALWVALLTERELDVVGLVAEGLGNQQIADRLCVSVRTVEVHLGRVFRKLDVRSRTELALLALQSG